MIRVTILLGILLGLSAWYFHFSRQMNQAGVVSYYDQQMELASQFNGEALCTMLAQDFQGSDVTVGPSGTQRTQMDRDRACENGKQAMEQFRKLSDATQGVLHPEFRIEIKSIEFSDDAKLATVNGTMNISMGEAVLARTRFTERLIRRRGKIFSHANDSRSWVYAGE